MAELNKSFSEFHENIVLHDSKEENLVCSRDANRKRIRKYFSETLQTKQPDFFQQGSGSFKTTANPISCEYDIDDGVYLQNLEDDFLQKIKTQAVHDWIAKAVEEATANVKDLNNCVRVIYACDYHIDLPIYAELNGSFYLASKKSGWVESDVKGFKDWFHEKLKTHGEQLRRNIRYLKAWADYKGYDEITGILITVLVCENQSNDDRDDISLVNTVKNIVTYIQVHRAVCMPVAPFDDLLSKLDASGVNSVIKAFQDFYDTSNKAINEEDIDEAYKLWNSLFGDRFKLHDKGEKKEKKEKDPPVVIVNPVKSWSDRNVV